MTATKQKNLIRINLSFTPSEFECITKYADELDLSLSGFIYANMKVATTFSQIFGHEKVLLGYIKLTQQIFDELLKADNKNNEYIELLETFTQLNKEISNTMLMSEKLHNFSNEWAELRALK